MINNLTLSHIEKIKEALKKEGISIPDNLFQANFNQHLKSPFQNISIPEIKARISKFRQIDLRKISDNELGEAISEVMNIEIDGLKMHTFYPSFGNYDTGTRFYRIRPIPFNQNELDQYSQIVAYWNPPVEKVNCPGRLNKIHESLLYTSTNPHTAMVEMKIQNYQNFVLIIYETIRPIKINIIGANNDIHILSEEDNKKFQLYNNFLREEFTKVVPCGSEYLYRVSEFIAKCYFDLPPRDVQDAWFYPSVASKGGYNICFRPEIAKESLKLVGALFCSMMNFKDNPSFKCYYIATLNTENKVTFSPDLNKMKELFPEFLPQ